MIYRRPLIFARMCKEKVSILMDFGRFSKDFPTLPGGPAVAQGSLTPVYSSPPWRSKWLQTFPLHRASGLQSVGRRAPAGEREHGRLAPHCGCHGSTLWSKTDYGCMAPDLSADYALEHVKGRMSVKIGESTFRRLGQGGPGLAVLQCPALQNDPASSSDRASYRCLFPVQNSGEISVLGGQSPDPLPGRLHLRRHFFRSKTPESDGLVNIE